jgi:hypothetical protein
MLARFGLFPMTAVALLVLVHTGTATAARVRYHYVPDNGTPCLRLAGAPNAPGERLSLSMRWEPYPCPPPRAVRPVCFRHPCTGADIQVPLGLPEGTPQIEHRPNRIVYNYGSYTVEAHFLDDGSVDVIYNSGLFRAP